MTNGKRKVYLYPPDLFFRCWMLPKHLNLPFTMMPSLVHNASHSSMLCDVSTTERPVLIMSRIKFQRNLRAFGSIPVVGSSCKSPQNTLTQIILFCTKNCTANNMAHRKTHQQNLLFCSFV